MDVKAEAVSKANASNSGKKIKLVSRRAAYFEAQLLFDQQTAFLRPEAAHLNFPGHILSQAAVQLCGNHHLITATKTGSITAPTQVPLRGINGNKRRLSISWHSTTVQAHTSARIAEVHRQPLQQLAELCLHHLSLQWQGGGTLLSGCFCQSKQRSLLPHPLAIQTESYKPVHWLCSISALCAWRGI